VLKKKNRLSKRSEFEEIRKDGNFLGFSRFFGILVLDKKDNELKFGTIISKKISKKAVERNKVKRRLMEVLGGNLEKFDGGKRVLFLAKKEVLDIKPEGIEKEIKKIFGWKEK
jgi:ribonuclease P protein component